MRSPRPTARTTARAWVCGTSLALLGSQLLTGAVLAASPTPTAIGGDPRSSGEGPGLVGEPLMALVLVIAIAIVSVLASQAYIVLTGGRSRDGDPPG